MSARARRAAVFVAALFAAVLIAPAAANAAVVAVTDVTLPATVSVGQTGVPASITLGNANTGADTPDTNTVCNVGEVVPCRVAEPGITLVPSCGMPAGNTCAGAGFDPGVFEVAGAAATGRAGTACAGTAFAVTLTDAPSGTYRLTPQPGGAHVSLVAVTATCIVDFTLNVLRSPTIDAAPVTAGIQTAAVTSHAQISGADGYAADAQATTTVLPLVPQAPSISTAASGNVEIGRPIADQATVTGLVLPVAGSTVTFRLYGPTAPTCEGTPLLTSTRPLTITGSTGSATSDAFVPATPGTYRWVATFNGDANNLPVTGACNDPNENVVVSLPASQLPPFPAKLEVARARVLSSARRLDVLAPITSRASGRVSVSFQAAGRTLRFTEAVDSDDARVTINRTIFSTQARLGTGILTLRYPGDADTQPQEVRLRAAVRPADLTAGRPRISAGRLLASGRISSSASGVVRLQLLYEPPGQSTRTLSFNATISRGRYSIDRALPADVNAQIAARRGVVHSYTLFTGYLRARMRGEMASFQVLGQRAGA